jgi:hypothetical protein
MEVKEAVRAAKIYTADLFADEKPSNVRLEEIEFDHGQNLWQVTVSFARHWPEDTPALTLALSAPLKRSYKVVNIANDDGHLISIRQREGLV